MKAANLRKHDDYCDITLTPNAAPLADIMHNEVSDLHTRDNVHKMPREKETFAAKDPPTTVINLEETNPCMKQPRGGLRF